MTREKKDILATLAYFNMFDYPLKKREIHSFLGHAADMNEFEQALNILVTELVVFKIGEFYSISNNYKLAEKRRKGNEKASLLLKKAARAAKLVAAFPFVRGVAVSGSLSKNFADDKADIDFFIITAPNRLWIARTLLHIFKKFTFLLNKQDMFCMNYFIDEAEPCIQEKNIFTATEVVTILPLCGNTVFEIFFAINNWTKAFLPNNYMRVASGGAMRKWWLKSAIEKMFSNKLGEWLDNFLMRLTAKSWDKKTRNKKTNSKGMIMSMHTGKHFSKPNPVNFQRKLLQRYENSLAEIFKQYEVSLKVSFPKL